MKTLVLFLATSLAVLASPVRPAIETTLRGATGSEVKFTIVAIWADGFHIRQAAGKPPLFITWDKVDAAWLAAERPEVDALRSAAKPFPSLTPEQAVEKLEAAKKLFRATKTITYSVTVSETRTVPNTVAERYAAKVRSLSPATITQGLSQIITDRQRDIESLSTNNLVDRAQRRWLEGTFTSFLFQLEKTQREIDPVNAGAIALPKLPGTSRTANNTEDNWF